MKTAPEGTPAAGRAVKAVPEARGVFDGWTSQHLYLAGAAQAAVTYGQAAAAGVRASPCTLERHFAPFLAADAAGFAARLDALTDPERAEWTILDGYVKRHPTCALLHGVNDAVEDLARARTVAPDDVRSVTVRTYRAAASLASLAPHNDLAARFSIPWTVASGLTLGTLATSAFEDDTLRRSDLRELAARVEVVHDPVLDAGYPDGRPATVSVELSDGTVLTSTRSGAPRGDGPYALDDPTVAGKAERLIAGVTDPESAAAVLAAVAAIGERGVGPLADRLRALVVRRWP